MARNLLYGLTVLSAGVAVDQAFALHPALHDSVHYVFVVLVAALVVYLRVVLDREEALARTDPLTGVPNRRTFIEAAEARIRRMQRDGAPCTVVYLDVDGFKAVNDVHGHAAGDAVLRMVGRTLSTHVRACDTVARLGGDEFAVLLEGDEAAPVITRLRAALREGARVNGWDLGFSIGAVTFRHAPACAESMLRRTDAAMYVAKQRGDEVVYQVA